MPWVTAILGGDRGVLRADGWCSRASPFETQIAPADGSGLEPVAAEPVHGRPPAGALPGLRRAGRAVRVLHGGAGGGPDATRAGSSSTRRWTLVAWAFLGVGMLLGAHWAYVEVGWGGYWAWDPVENAALMPWLAATAFLHSVMVQEKKGMLKVWNMVLVSRDVRALRSSARSSPAAASCRRSTRSCSRTSAGTSLGFIAVIAVCRDRR